MKAIRLASIVRLSCTVLLCLISVLGAESVVAAETNESPKQVTAPTYWVPAIIRYICDSNMPEPAYLGSPVSHWVSTNVLLNPGKRSPCELLKLTRLSGPDERGVIRYEIPFMYDATDANYASNPAKPRFGVNLALGFFDNEGNFVSCNLAGYERAKNGHCLVWWNTTYNGFDMHNIRVKLDCLHAADLVQIYGPPLQVESSNVCRFFEGETFFNAAGARLYAELRSLTAKFHVELLTPEGKHLKTVTGSTTDGYITNEWDLVDEHGKKFDGDAFEALFYVTFPGDTHKNAPIKVRFNQVADSILNEKQTK